MVKRGTRNRGVGSMAYTGKVPQVTSNLSRTNDKGVVLCPCLGVVSPEVIECQVGQLLRTLERLTEAVYHAEVYQDAPHEVREALANAQVILGL